MLGRSRTTRKSKSVEWGRRVRKRLGHFKLFPGPPLSWRATHPPLPFNCRSNGYGFSCPPLTPLPHRLPGNLEQTHDDRNPTYQSSWSRARPASGRRVRRAVFLGAVAASIAGCAYLQPIPATESAVPAPLAAPDSPLARHLQQLQGVRDPLEVVPPLIAVISLVDDSGFREGIWNFGVELAGALASAVEGSPRWLVVPPEAVSQAVGAREKLSREELLEVGRLVQADLVVGGVVEAFDMKRRTVGDPLLGGYKSFTGLADLRLRVVRCRDGFDLGEVITAQEEVVQVIGQRLSSVSVLRG